MLNKVILQGRLTREPELKTTQSGLSVVRFSVAVDRNFKDEQTGGYQADFIDCIAWRKTAEFVQQYFHKGNPIIVEGSIQNDNYTDSQGVKHYGYIVSVFNVYFGMNSKGGTQGNAPQAAPAKAAPQSSSSPANDVDIGQLGDYEELISDGEVPF